MNRDYLIVITGSGEYPNATDLRQILEPYFGDPTSIRAINALRVADQSSIVYTPPCRECEEEG